MCYERAMRSAFFVATGLLAASASLAAFAACSSSSDSSPGTTPGGGDAATDSPSSIPPGSDAAAGDSSTISDAGADAEQPLTIQTEVEPNNGATTTEIGKMVLPGTMNGKIDPANDTDIFAITVAPGDYWEWTGMPTSADLAPHVTVFDTAGGDNPTRIGFSAAGQPTTVQHFVLNTGTFVAVMRDARNVGADGGKGGPTFGYALTGKRATPAPVTVTFPSTKTGKLASLGALDFFTFTGTGGKGWDIVINAARKQPASTLDSRISLFDLTAKKWLITNDNVATSTDSAIGSADPAASTYLVIVENEGADPTDLSYQIVFTLRP